MRFKNFTQGFFIGSVLGGGLGAATGAMSGATGAAILSRNYNGYDVNEAAGISALGNGLINGIMGGLVGAAVACGWSPSPSDDSTRKSSGLTAYVGGQVLGALAGYGLLGAESMSLGQIAASTAVGASVTIIPAALGIVCCAGCVVLCLGGIERSPTVIRYNHHQPAQQTQAQAVPAYLPPAQVIAPQMEEQKELIPARIPAHNSFQTRYAATGYSDDEIPNGMKDPISMLMMNNPMLLTNCGHSFDEDNLISLSAHSNKCPCCRKPITQRVTNVNLKQSIEDFVTHAEERKKQEVDKLHDAPLVNDIKETNAPIGAGAPAAAYYGLFARNQDLQRAQINNENEGVENQIEGYLHEERVAAPIPAAAPGGPQIKGMR